MNLEISKTGKYIPENKVNNIEIEKKFNLEEGYILKRTGIKNRNNVKEEEIEEIALKAVINLLEKTKEKTKIDIDLIITSTTTTNKLMPGISNYIQKELNIKKCICLDILSGCAGFINAFEIACLYIQTKKIKRALVIGVDILSKVMRRK